jgi:hypothetical protein
MVNDGISGVYPPATSRTKNLRSPVLNVIGALLWGELYLWEAEAAAVMEFTVAA